MNSTLAAMHFTLARTSADMIVREHHARLQVTITGYEPALHTALLLEAHAGMALERLEAMNPSERRDLVVVTRNPCPGYAMDLWDLGPAILLVGAPTPNHLSRALEDASSNRHYREPSAFASGLIPSERTILRFLPRGACNKRISSELGLSDRTVRNRLVDIGEKLGLENRTQIAMCYAGQWQWLERFRSLLTTSQAQGTHHEPNNWSAN